MAEARKHQEHPLVNILINVLIPVLALSHLSKDPELQQALGKAVKPWHIGPVNALWVALAFPIGYGIWHFLKTRKANFFSALGLVSVLLTGCLTIFLWNKDGTVKPHADILFGLKEASIPLMLGIAVIGSHFTPAPLLPAFLYSDSIFDIPKIQARVNELDARELCNERVAKLTGWGFAVIGVPILAFLFLTLRNLLKDLGKLTGLKDDDLLLPR